MEVFKNFLVFPIDYKSKIAFLSLNETSESWSFDVDWSFPLNTAKTRGFLEKDEDDENKTNDGKSEDKGVHLIAVSEVNNLLAFSTNEKSLFLCKIEDNQVKILSRRLFVRTTSSLKFSSCGKILFLADKTGDVFEYSCEDQKAPGKFILGHISQILDLQVSHNTKYILTSDRDEKIRVTNYPATHEIESFCLGHLEFVSSFDFIDDDRIVSVSGDKTLRLWKFVDGTQLDVFELEIIPLEVKVSKLSSSDGLIFISTMDNKLFIFDYRLEENKIKLQRKSEKEYPSAIEVKSCDGKFYVKFVQDEKVFIDQVNVKEKLTIFKNLHEDISLIFKASDLKARTFKPFDIKYLFKNARIEGNDVDHEERKKLRVDELKEKTKQNNKKRNYNRNKKNKISEN